MTVQVHEPGDHLPPSRRARREERGLIQAQRSRCPETGRIINQRGAVFPHGGHRGVPTHPEGESDPSDAVAVLADPPADLGPGPHRERRPRADQLAGLGPRARRALELRTRPDALRPHEAHRPARDRQVPHLHATATVSDRAHPTVRAADPIRGGLHRQPPLARFEQLHAHDEARQSDERGRALATVHDHQGSPSLAASDSRKSGEAPGLDGGPIRPALPGHGPTLHREEPPNRLITHMDSSWLKVLVIR